MAIFLEENFEPADVRLGTWPEPAGQRVYMQEHQSESSGFDLLYTIIMTNGVSVSVKADRKEDGMEVVRKIVNALSEAQATQPTGRKD